MLSVALLPILSVTRSQRESEDVTSKFPEIKNSYVSIDFTLVYC